MKISKTTIYRFITIFVIICLINTAYCGVYKKISKKQKSLNKNLRKLQSDETDDTDYPFTPNNTEPLVYKGSSSGLSAGGICAIAIPCIAALVGVGAAAAILGGSASSAASGLSAVPNIPPPTIATTNLPIVQEPTLANLNPVVPEIVQPPVIQPPPQPVQPIIKPVYPVNNIQPPVVKPIIQQPVVTQPQLVPVQQIQLVPVQQVEMVPVKKVEMVPVQQVVPVTEVQPAVATEQFVQEIPQVTQVTGIESNAQMGMPGSEFISAPEGYGTSAIQGIGQTSQVIGNIGNNAQMGMPGSEFISAPEGYGTSAIQGIGQTKSSEGFDFSLNNLL